jgi:hypothetical protein
MGKQLDELRRAEVRRVQKWADEAKPGKPVDSESVDGELTVGAMVLGLGICVLLSLAAAVLVAALP